MVLLHGPRLDLALIKGHCVNGLVTKPQPHLLPDRLHHRGRAVTDVQGREEPAEEGADHLHSTSDRDPAYFQEVVGLTEACHEVGCVPVGQTRVGVDVAESLELPQRQSWGGPDLRIEAFLHALDDELRLLQGGGVPSLGSHPIRLRLRQHHGDGGGDDGVGARGISAALLDHIRPRLRRAYVLRVGTHVLPRGVEERTDVPVVASHQLLWLTEVLPEDRAVTTVPMLALDEWGHDGGWARAVVQQLRPTPMGPGQEVPAVSEHGIAIGSPPRLVETLGERVLGVPAQEGEPCALRGVGIADVPCSHEPGHGVYAVHHKAGLLEELVASELHVFLQTRGHERHRRHLPLPDGPRRRPEDWGWRGWLLL